MNAVLDQLFRLQDRIRFVRSRQKQRDTVPEELVEVDRDYQEKVAAANRPHSPATSNTGKPNSAPVASHAATSGFSNGT